MKVVLGCNIIYILLIRRLGFNWLFSLQQFVTDGMPKHSLFTTGSLCGIDSMKFKRIFAAQCHFLPSAVSTVTGIELSYRALYLHFFVFLQSGIELGGNHIVSIR